MASRWRPSSSDSTQVKVQLAASLLAIGQTAGVAVRNQVPQERISNAKPFESDAPRSVSSCL